MFVHEVYVKPEYRGYGIGLLALHAMFSGEGLPAFDGTVMLSPQTITRYTPPGTDLGVARKKLQEYWALLGFKVWHEAARWGFYGPRAFAPET
jgi:GNAT superfamily N-acetyltransferase